MPQQRYAITAALPYTNGPIHIGHLAGVYVPADIYARYLRMKGEDVFFVVEAMSMVLQFLFEPKKGEDTQRNHRSLSQYDSFFF